MTMREAIPVIRGKRLGMVAVMDSYGRLAGIIMDGDLRRGLQRRPDLLEYPVRAVMMRQPKCNGTGDLTVQTAQMSERVRR